MTQNNIWNCKVISTVAALALLSGPALVRKLWRCNILKCTLLSTITIAIFALSGPALADTNCNTPAVQEQYKELTCQNLANLDTVDVKTCSELKALNNEQILQRMRAKHLFEKSPNDNEANLQYKKYNEQMVLLRFAGARDLIEGATFVAVDVDKNLKRYTCQAYFQLNQQAATNWMYSTIYDNAEKNGEFKLVLFATIKENNVRVSKMMIDQVLTAVPNAANNWVALMAAKGVKFYVQPKDPNAWFSSEFIITDVP